MSEDSQQETITPTTVPEVTDTNSSPDWYSIREALLAPFESHLVNVKVVARNQEKTKGLAAVYLGTRPYEDRLDEVVGFENWQSHYETWGDSQLICHLTILGVTKSDVGEADPKDGNTATSAKAQSFKRACSVFGLGRYLYELPKVWGPLTENGKQFKNPEALVREIYMKGGIVPSQNGTRPQPPQDAAPAPRSQRTNEPSSQRERPASAPKDETLNSGTNAEQRDHSGEAIFRSDWVEKIENDGRTVFRISMRDVADSVWGTYYVSKNDRQETMCDCPGFKTGYAQEGAGARFKCEHMYAVVHYLRHTAKEAGEKSSGSVLSATYQGDPRGTTTANLINPERHGLIRAISKGAKLDPEAECQRLLGCKVEDLSRDAADWFVEQLKVIAAKPVNAEAGAQVSVSMAQPWKCSVETQRKLVDHWTKIVNHPLGMSDEEMRDTFRSQYDDAGAPESLDQKTAASAEGRLKNFLDSLKIQADQNNSKSTTGGRTNRR